MNREMTLTDAVLVLLISPFYIVFWVARAIIQFLILFGIVLLCIVIGAASIVMKFILGKR